MNSVTNTHYRQITDWWKKLQNGNTFYGCSAPKYFLHGCLSCEWPTALAYECDDRWSTHETYWPHGWQNAGCGPVSECSLFVHCIKNAWFYGYTSNMEFIKLLWNIGLTGRIIRQWRCTGYIPRYIVAEAFNAKKLTNKLLLIGYFFVLFAFFSFLLGSWPHFIFSSGRGVVCLRSHAYSDACPAYRALLLQRTKNSCF